MAQKLYVTTHAATELSRSLVTWITFVIVGEQYCMIYKPHIALRLSNTIDKAIKMCITVLNLIILVNLVHFFKLVLKPIGVDNYARICLSNIYIYKVKCYV